jgi:hypothetical protein
MDYFDHLIAFYSLSREKIVIKVCASESLQSTIDATQRTPDWFGFANLLQQKP